MIKSAKEAREHLNIPETEYERLHGPLNSRSFAAGYLGCLEGPEIGTFLMKLKPAESLNSVSKAIDEFCEAINP